MFFSVKCSCGGFLIFNEYETIRAYSKDMDYVVDDFGKILDKTIQSYLFFSCPKCNKLEKMTYKEWELYARKSVAEKVMLVRRAQIINKIKGKINEDNGIIYCGKCSGYGDDGWCLIDIYNLCDIRTNDSV